MTNITKPAIGFIGLGLMGSAMVQRLQSLDYPITVVANRSRTAIDQAIARGASEAKSASELAMQCDVIMICVDTSETVESIMNSENGVLSSIRPGTLVIDFGTSIPGSTRRLAAACTEKGASMMDAPLGRTPAQAVDGLLNIMAAGEKADYDRALPVLKDLGENVFHVGSIGAGHTLKLINNFFGMTTVCAMSEAFAVADLAGLNRQTVYDVMSSGPLRSGMMDMVKASAIDGQKNSLEFSINNGCKDVGYYTEMTKEMNVPGKLSSSVVDRFGLAINKNEGNRFVSEMVDVIAEDFEKQRG